MERDQAAQLLRDGVELDGIVLAANGRVIARGKVRQQGTILSAVYEAECTDLQLCYRGDRVTVPFLKSVTVQRGEPLEIQFGPTWNRRGQ